MHGETRKIRKLWAIASGLVCLATLPGCALELISRSTQSSGGMKLEVPIPVIHLGNSSNVVAVTFETSQTRIDTTDYDGTVSYFFEVIASNTDAVARNISLVNQSGATQASISVAAGTANETRFRTTWTPNTGVQIYRLKVDATTGANQLIAKSARILIRQVDATKTRLYVPLVSQYGHASWTNQDINTILVSGTSSTYFDSNLFMVYLPINLSRYAGLSSSNAFRLEAVISGDNAANTVYASLFNRNTTNPLPDSELSTNATVPTIVSKDFSVGAAELTDGHTLSLKIRSGDNINNAYLAKAGLWIKLVNFTKGEVYYPILGRSNGNDYFTAHRIALDTDAFTNPSVYYEVNGHTDGVETKFFELYDHGANDSDQLGISLIPSASLTINTATQTVVRSPALTGITSGNRLIGHVDNSLGPQEAISGFVVVGFQAQ